MLTNLEELKNMQLNELGRACDIIGVFLGGKNLLVGKITSNHQLTKSFCKEIDNRESEEYVLNEIFCAIDALFDDRVNAIGVGVPSLVDLERGIVYDPVHIPSWHEVYLKDLLEQRFNVHVKVNNDANCFILGERYFGKAGQVDNAIGVIVGTGLGCGILINGKLYSGKNCGAGEIGSVPYRDFDYEYYCSIGYFIKKYGVRYDVLINRAKDEDKIALAIMEQYGIDLGNAIKTIILAYDPEMIIIGGALAEGFPYYEESMRKVVRSFSYKHILDNLVIESNSDPMMPAMGAAALFYNDSLYY